MSTAAAKEISSEMSASDKVSEGKDDFLLLAAVLENKKIQEPIYGPLSKYISEDANDLLELDHLQDTFVVGNPDDLRAVREAAKFIDVPCPRMIMLKYSIQLYKEANNIPGIESLPVPVANVFLDYGKIYISYQESFTTDPNVEYVSNLNNESGSSSKSLKCEDCKVVFTSADTIVVRTTGMRKFTDRKGEKRENHGNVYLHFLQKCLKAHDQHFEFSAVTVLRKTQELLSENQILCLCENGCVLE